MRNKTLRLITPLLTGFALAVLLLSTNITFLLFSAKAQTCTNCYNGGIEPPVDLAAEYPRPR